MHMNRIVRIRINRQNIKKKCISQNVTNITNMIATVALVIIACYTYALNRRDSIEKRGMLEAKKYQIANQIKSLLTEYINYSIEMIAREKIKFVELDISVANSKNLINVPVYLNKKTSLEHSFYLRNPYRNTTEDTIIDYFKKFRIINFEVDNILEKDEYVKYKDFVRKLELCNLQIKYYCSNMRYHEFSDTKYYSQLYLIRQKKETIKFVLNEDRPRRARLDFLRKHIRDVKEAGFSFLSELSETGIEAPKFICTLDTELPWGKKNQLCVSLLDNATIEFDSLHYKYDYYKYFIENMDVTDSVIMKDLNLQVYVEN